MSKQRPSPEPQPLASFVGPRLRELREEGGYTQDYTARALRRFGLRWTRSMLARVERGERPVSLEELVVLGLYFGKPLAELFRAGDMVELTREAAVTSDHLEEILRGHTPSLRRNFDTPFQREDVPKALAALERITRRRELMWPKLLAHDLFAAEKAAAGDAEAKGARSIEVDPIDLAIAARRLYGRNLTEERDEKVLERAEADASLATIRALRGHATRELLAEIKQEIDEAKRRARRKQ